MTRYPSLFCTLGAWLLAAPAFFAQPQTSADPGDTPLAASELLRYTLEETSTQLTRVLGPPVQISDTGVGFKTWYYQTDVLDQHEFSHLLMFRKSDGKLVSVTRNFHSPIAVDALFPERTTRTHHWPSESDRKWSIRVRTMTGDRVAIAMGAAKPGDRTTQVVILRRSTLKTFMPWLADQVGEAGNPE
jgi:hypothetical protein